jgi:GTP-binding protein
VSYQVEITKADKPSVSDFNKAVAVTKAAIAKRPAAYPDLLLTSSQKGDGIPELRATIARLFDQ